MAGPNSGKEADETDPSAGRLWSGKVSGDEELGPNVNQRRVGGPVQQLRPELVGVAARAGAGEDQGSPCWIPILRA